MMANGWMTRPTEEVKFYALLFINIGKYFHLDGNSFEGSWYFDQHFGLGMERFKDKDTGEYNRYEGNYWKGKKHGNGRFFWANGSYYAGQFKDDNLHGKNFHFIYKVRGNIASPTDVNILGIGNETKCMVREPFTGPIEELSLEIIDMTRKKARVLLSSTMK